MTEAPNFTSHTRQVGQVYAPNMTVGEISNRLTQQAETVAKYLLPNGKRDGLHWVVGSVHGNEGQSLKVVLSGEKAGRWMDHNDKQYHGDLVDLFQFTQGVEKGEAVKAAKEFLGIQDGKPTQRTAKPKPQSGVIKPPPDTWKGKKKIHTWDYTSEDQKIGSVVRYEDDQGRKEVIPFFQFNGKAGIPKGLSMPLYGRTDPAYAFVMEGEKCVDAMLQMGLAAVTSQGGSGAARKADWSVLKDVKTVYLLSDNDEAGQTYIRDVVATLQAQNSERELKVIELDGLPEKGDIVDWIQARIPDWDGYDEDGRIAGLKDELRTLVGDAKCIQPPPLHHCNLINMAAVEMEPVEWLWPGRFPLGKLCLLGGKPGVGKTQISLSIAAIVTIGGKWFDSGTRAKKGKVLFLTSEDDLADTVGPRLMAAGADLSKVTVLQSVVRVHEDRVIDGFFSLGRDIQQLDGVLKSKPGIRLVIFDPLQAYLGVKDAHRNADVREVLGPLSALANKHRVTVLGIEHLGKNAGRVDPMAAFLGSTGIIASARSAYLVCKDKDDDQGDRLFLPVKQNLSPDNSGLTYRLVGKTLDNGIETSCIEWTGHTDQTARDALDETGMKRDSPAEDDAEDFLLHLLSHGPVKVADVRSQAKEAGHAWRTVERAKSNLGYKAKNRGQFYGNAWWWMTPEQLAEDEVDLRLKNAETGGGRQHIRVGGLLENEPENESQNSLKANTGNGLSNTGGSPPSTGGHLPDGGLPPEAENTPEIASNLIPENDETELL